MAVAHGSFRRTDTSKASGTWSHAGGTLRTETPSHPRKHGWLFQRRGEPAVNYPWPRSYVDEGSHTSKTTGRRLRRAQQVAWSRDVRLGGRCAAKRAREPHASRNKRAAERRLSLTGGGGTPRHATRRVSRPAASIERGSKSRKRCPPRTTNSTPANRNTTAKGPLVSGGTSPRGAGRVGSPGTARRACRGLRHICRHRIAARGVFAATRSATGEGCKGAQGVDGFTLAAVL